MLAIAIVYLVALMFLGWYAHRQSEARKVGDSRSFALEYFLGSRSYGWFAICLTTVATMYSAGTFLGAPGLAYGRGYVWSFAVGFQHLAVPLLFLIAGIKFAIVARKNNLVTYLDFFRERYESNWVVYLGGIGTVLFLMLGLNRLTEKFSAPALLLAVIFFAVTSSFLTLFFRHEKREPNPIMDITLSRSKPFLAANVYNLIIGAGVMGIFSFIPLYAVTVYNVSTLASGMILTPRSLAIIPASAITSFLLRRWGYRSPMIWGLIIISFSTILLGEHGLEFMRKLGIPFGVAATLSILIMIGGIGMGIALPASNNAVIELMPEKVATITGLRGMFRSVGAAIGISLITLILHLSSSPALGFRITFVSFGLALLLTIPLVFLMPTGKNSGEGS